MLCSRVRLVAVQAAAKMSRDPSQCGVFMAKHGRRLYRLPTDFGGSGTGQQKTPSKFVASFEKRQTAETRYTVEQL